MYAYFGPRRMRAVVAAAALVAALGASHRASAANKVWAQGSGKWTEDGNWEPFGQPVTGDNVTYQDAGDGDETLTYDHPTFLSINSLTLLPTRDTITFLQNGPLLVGDEIMSAVGSSVHRVSAGAELTIDRTFTLGNKSEPRVSALLEIAGQGSATLTGLTVASGGTLNVKAGGSVYFYGPTTQSGGVVNFVDGPNSSAADLSGYQYSLSGGTLSTVGEIHGAFAQSGGTHTASILTALGTYTLSGGTLQVGTYNLIAGVVQSGGTHNVTGQLQLAKTASSYALQGGVLNAALIKLDDGIFSQAGGTLNAANFQQNGGTVQGVLQNKGYFRYTGGVFLGRLVNEQTVDQAAPVFTLVNGLDNRAALVVTLGHTLTLMGTTSNNSGALTLDGGTVNGAAVLRNEPTGTIAGNGRIQVGLDNAGVLTATGGNLYLTGNVLNSGTLANAAGGNLFVQPSFLSHTGSVLARSGGSVVFTKSITNADGQRVTLAGGTVSAPSIANAKGGLITGSGDVSADLVNDGDMTFNGPTRLFGALTNNAGGTVTARNSQVLVFGPAINTGTIRAVSGGSVVFDGGVSEKGTAGAAVPGAPAGAPAVGTGQLLVDAGGSVVTNYVRQSAVSLAGNAGDPASYGRLSIRRRADGGDTSVLSSLTFQADATGAPLGRLDLADTAMILDYPAGGPSPLANVRALIARGYAGGTWAGNGITSSEAAGRPADRALGFAEATDVLSASGGVFQGQSADASSVVVRYTLAGDAGLDGRVNFDDLLRLARHYNTTGPGATWSAGDFNYDQVVNFADLLTLARNYNGALPADPIPGAAGDFATDLSAAAALASVPEPGLLGVAAGAAGAMSLTRARRRRA